MSNYYDEADYTLVHNEHLARMKSLLARIYKDAVDRDGGGDASFSGELLEELRRFVKANQLEERDHAHE